MTDSEELALVEAAYARRLAGDAYESYTEAEKRFAGASLEWFARRIDQLRERVSLASAGCFRLAEPFDL